ncbi:TPA: hypothetical protein DCR49_04720 [Candidatus Delongbacteria bacterium]|nr:hypothetical protein [Candidatus Delongbacteria bacterium]
MKLLINSKCFTSEWINQKKEALSGDPVLIEKVINAFALLGYLAQLRNDFVFKGGTSLIIHTDNIKRLSIDIDIVFGGDIFPFEEMLSQIAAKSPFTRFEEDERGERGLPNRKHYKFFYISSISDTEDSVLLDVVLDSIVYLPFTEEKIIRSNIFETDFDLPVKTLTIEGLLGDKLTAFAPHTIGVPFETQKGKIMTMQVVKQLFDLGELFDIATYFDKTAITFKETFIKENSYHLNKHTEAEVLDDTINLCHLICLAHLKGYKPKDDINKFEDGLKKLSNHLLGVQFSIHTEAKITASKVFYIASSIKNNKHRDFKKDRFTTDKIRQIKDINLPSPYNYLNRLKSILPEAFYYIWKGIEE